MTEKRTPLVYKVFDDEWSEIVGVEQLSMHATVQLQSFEDEIGDNVEDVENKDEETILNEELAYRLDDCKDDIKIAKEVLKKYRENPHVTLSAEESTIALRLRYFEVEPLDIH